MKYLFLISFLFSAQAVLADDFYSKVMYKISGSCEISKAPEVSKDSMGTTVTVYFSYDSKKLILMADGLNQPYGLAAVMDISSFSNNSISANITGSRGLEINLELTGEKPLSALKGTIVSTNFDESYQFEFQCK